MPYKSEKINIQNTIYDRRQKLSNDQKEYMRWLREEYGYSYQQLADMFGVSKRLAIFICKPETLEKVRAQFIERRKDGRYKPSKEEWAATMRDHRNYKQNLYNSGKIHGIMGI